MTIGSKTETNTKGAITMKKTIPVVCLSWKKFYELYEGKHEVEGRKYRYGIGYYYRGA